MKLRDAFRIALTGLTTNLPRSALTTLGIVIGVTAVILVMAVSRGGTEIILRQVQGIGSRTVFVRAGQEPRGPSDIGELFTDSLRDREVRALGDPARVPGVMTLTPNVVGSATLAQKGETKRVSVVGTASAFGEIFQLPTPAGRFLREEDVRAHARVVVLGAEVARELFGSGPVVGEEIKIKQRPFRVIGVFAHVGLAGPFDVDQIAIVPVTTAQRELLGITHYNSIVVRAASEIVVPRVAEDIRRTLRELHGITDPEKDDFFVGTQADLLRIIGTITGALTLLLVSIAAISLVVGGIGIMNIMLVSVTERTREIGLRKAVGATTRDILLQFLFEALVLTLIGGAVGTAIGVGLSYIASIVLGQRLGVSWRFSVPLSSILLGVGVAAVVGLIFGLYPARKASHKSPIEALRHE